MCMDFKRHCNSLEHVSRSTPIRVLHQSIRARTFFAKAVADGYTDSVPGEVSHVEAQGEIVVNTFHQLSGAMCGSLADHGHCTADHGCAGHARIPRTACCIIPESYPMSIRFDMPVGDGVVPLLGDELLVTICNQRRLI